MFHFLKKERKTPVDIIMKISIYNSWDIEQKKLKLVILSHVLPFIPLKTPKIKIWKTEKNC